LSQRLKERLIYCLASLNVAFVPESFTREEQREKILKGVAQAERKDSDGSRPPLYMPAHKDTIDEGDINPLIDCLMSLMPKEKNSSW